MHVQEVAAAVALDDRHEGPGDQERAVEVGLELPAYVVDRGVEEGRADRGTGVVDQYGDVFRLCGGRRHGSRVGDLQRHRDRIGVRHGARVAGRGVNLAGAARVQLLHQRLAYATAATGDEDVGALQCGHDYLHRMRNRSVSAIVNRSVFERKVRQELLPGPDSGELRSIRDQGTDVRPARPDTFRPRGSGEAGRRAVMELSNPGSSGRPRSRWSRRGGGGRGASWPGRRCRRHPSRPTHPHPPGATPRRRKGKTRGHALPETLRSPRGVSPDPR